MKLQILTRFPRLREVAGVVFVFAAIAYAAALLSYNPYDPSFNTATAARRPENFIGRVGSYGADLSFQSVGIVAWLLPLLMAWAGWRWVRGKDVGPPIVRFAGYSAMVLSLASALTLIAPVQPEEQSYEVGGVLGLLISSSLSNFLNPIGTLILLAAVFVVSIYLVSAFSLAQISGTVETWLASGLSRLRLARVRRKEEEALEPVVEQAPRSRRRAAAAAAGAGESYALTITPPGLEADLAPEYGSFVPDEPAPIRDQVLAQEAALLANGTAYSNGHHAMAAPPITEAPPWDVNDIPIKAIEDSEPLTITPRPPEPKKAAPKKAEVATSFKLPPPKLLNAPPEREGYDSNELKDVAGHIKSKLEEFSVYGNVVQINPGPVVTTFEFKPDAGVKIAKITTLSEDLCLGLQAESILIERIPGKPTVGIEVPNTRRETISLRQIIESEEFHEAPSRLTIAMGKDISGRIRISELEKMPHLLIAGSTGSGKSVMLNCLIMSVIYKSTPDEVRMILVDPKRVELGIYDGIPHLLTPVITEPKKAVNALRNAVLEMERRLKLLASYGVRNIDQFNKKIRQMNEKPMALFPEDEDPEAKPPERPLPYILIVIDELADLMMLERAGVEESVIRLAQMARAVGMHIVLATQRPSVDVITGLIKANFPARISFRVATRVDSRTVLDVMGAEHLLGKGDMLFLPPGTSRLVRVHGAFVTESEIVDVVEYWKKQAQPDYDQSYLIAPPSDDDEPDTDEEFDGEQDPMYQDAVRVVLEMGKASTSILQRRLRLGYGRAARILDMMQREGIIGPPDGSRPREVLKRPDWLDEVETALR